jgi:hypothetical protein
MAAYEAFLSRVLPEVAGCPEVVAIQAIRDAAIEFCTRSNALQQDLDPLTAIANQSEYDLEAPAGYRVSRVMKAWFEDSELLAAAPDMIRVPDAYKRSAGKAKPTFYFQKTSATISLLDVPETTAKGAVTIRAALTPTRASTTVDDEIFELWAEEIAHGAKYRLMLVAGKPYSNTAASAIEKGLFEAGVNKATLQAARGYVRSSVRVKFRKI